MQALSTATRTTARTALRAAATRSGATVRYSSTMHDNDPKTLEREKQRNLAGKQHQSASTPHQDSHAPGWNEHLASASEASVKADKSPEGSAADLQRKTVEGIKKRHMHDDSSEPTTASFSRDSVEGPLSDSGGSKEFVKKTVHEETTEVLKDKLRPTSSEESVKADRGDV